MKQFYGIRYPLGIIALALVVLASISCDPQQGGTGTLHLALDSGKTFTGRNIDPDGEHPLSIATYQIKGTGPNGEILSSITTENANLVIDGLVMGWWTIEASAFNNMEKILVSGSVKTYISSQSNSADLIMDAIPGTGTLDLTFSWNPEQTDSTTELTIMLKDSTGKVLTMEPTTINLATGQATLECTLPAGFHTLFVSMDNGDECLSGHVESVRIIDGTQSTGTVPLIIGTVIDSTSLTLINGTLSPISGTIACEPSIPVRNQSATLTYTPVLSEGVVSSELSVQWYLEGQAIQGATSFILEIQAVLPGTHRYDVVVSHPSQGSIGSTGLLIQVPTLPVVVNPST